ncbi:MAG: ATP-binding protein [Myxacorys californica WJT36-NPBG1]|jgi:hypothetical protein|nr:ATP-binding protein [Myxacorys californica WJT36-NPBG1]
MPAERTEPFLDNWTYLKVELNWLEKLLLMTVARQRKDLKEVERVAQTKADRVTSHWWKGIVSLEGNASYDTPPARKKADSEGHPETYQQQMKARMQASRDRGIKLALPILCDRFDLSAFEKNVLLLGLAPEVHRRYAQLYGYLQTGRECQDLPTVDLALRLFCRNDGEWRVARSQLTEAGALIRHQLIELDDELPLPLLSRTLKVADEWVDYLLSESPQWNAELIPDQATEVLGPGWVQFCQATKVEQVAPLVLPEELQESLKHLGDRIQHCDQVDVTWDFQTGEDSPGTVVLMVGKTGTGKATATRTIANRLDVPFVEVDLAVLTPAEQRALLLEVTIQAPTVLLIRSAEIWVGRMSALPSVEMAKLLQARRSLRGLTVFSVQSQLALRAEVRSQLQFTLKFPTPDLAARQLLWNQAFAPHVPLDEDIDWAGLAEKFALTGGEIDAIARSAAFFAAGEGETAKIGMTHLKEALALHRSGA